MIPVYKCEWIIQENVLNEWVDKSSKDSLGGAQIMEDAIRFEAGGTKGFVPKTRILFRETFTEIREKVIE